MNVFYRFCKSCKLYIVMDEKLKNSENEAQIIKHEDLARHNSRGIYMRDDHCDWGSSGMKDLVETLNDNN